VSRVTVYACLRKALAMGLEGWAQRRFSSPKSRASTMPTSLVVHLACTKPKDLAYAAELGPAAPGRRMFANTPPRPPPNLAGAPNPP